MYVYIYYTIQAVKPHFTAQSLNCIARIIYHLLPSKIDPSDPHLDGRLLKYYDILSQQLYPIIYTIYEGTTNSDTGDFCGAALQSLFHKNKPHVIQRFIDMGFPLMLLQKLQQSSSLIFYKFKSHVTDTLSECYEYSSNCQKVVLRQLLKDPICQIHEMKEQCIRGTYFNIYYDVIDKLRNQMITTESVCITAVSIPVVSSKSSTIPTITSNSYLSSSSSKNHDLSVSSCSNNYQQSTSSSSPPSSSSSSIDLYNNLSSLQASRTNKSRFPKSLTTTTTATTSTTTSSTATIVTRLASSIKSRTSSSMLIENNSADSVRQVVNNVRFISLKSSKSSSSQLKSSSSSSQSKTSSSSSLHSKRNNEVAAVKDKAISSKYSNNNYSTEELNTTKDNDTSVDQVDDTQSSYHSSPVEMESPLLKDMWTCAHCLFDNITSEEVCSICMT
jgi:hypothetical protein